MTCEDETKGISKLPHDLHMYTYIVELTHMCKDTRIFLQLTLALLFLRL